MKRSFTISLLFGVLFSFATVAPGFSQEVKIATTGDLQNLMLTNADVSDIIGDLESLGNIYIDEMKIDSLNNNYYLMANDKKHQWVYIFKLKNRRDNLFMDTAGPVNACNCNEMSLETFNIKEGDVSGCVKCGHKVSTRLPVGIGR